MQHIKEILDKIPVEESSTQEVTRITHNHFDVFDIKDCRKIFNFQKCLAFLEAKGKHLFGEHFRIQREDHKLIYKLLVYIIRDNENCKKHSLSLKKGILLSGPVGCGKTSLMTLIRFFLPTPEWYLMKSCRQISFEFIAEGYDVIRKYSFGLNQTPQAFCFDDLGTENNLKYYGNECNVMGEILVSRYELFIYGRTYTHLTTNLNSSEIEQYYGQRLRSRMREMFNLVAFDRSIKDKRT